MTISIVAIILIPVLFLFIGLPVIITNRYETIQNFVNDKNIIIFSIIIFAYKFIADIPNGILYNTNFLHSAAYAFGYIYLGAFILALPVPIIKKLFKGDFKKDSKNSFFFALILILIVSLFQDYVQK